MTGPVAAWLADGRRLHLQHGPIDLIIEADGPPDRRANAYDRARQRFETVLTGLVEELPLLRTDCPPQGLGLKGPIARRMERVVRPFSDYRVTPMAAVAGAVADEMLAAMTEGSQLDRAYVNNGGDIALFLADGRRFELAMVTMAARPNAPAIIGKIGISSGDAVGGVATSGRHGRSHSLGIADSVTVLAVSAAVADACATLIANAVDLPKHPLVKRVPAQDLDPDSDLGDRLVTVAVPRLSHAEVATALTAGQRLADRFCCQGMIRSAALCLGDQIQLVGDRSAWHVERGPSPTGSGPGLAFPNRPDDR
ncbi:MAG: UPF0280 family protein [Geminicoccaceae bacterium]